MTTEDFVSRLDGVRRTARGWVALCPAHAEKTGSISIREGTDGRILLHDFAGCSPREIVAALGLELKDLFADAPLSKGQRPAPKPPKVDRVALAFGFNLAGLDLRLRAERIREAGKALTVAAMTDDALDRALGCMAGAHADEERAELFEHVADTLRERDFNERNSRERPACAA